MLVTSTDSNPTLDFARHLRAKLAAAQAEPHGPEGCRLHCVRCRAVGRAQVEFDAAIARLSDADYAELLREAEAEVRAARAACRDGWHEGRSSARAAGRPCPQCGEAAPAAGAGLAGAMLERLAGEVSGRAGTAGGNAREVEQLRLSLQAAVARGLRLEERVIRALRAAGPDADRACREAISALAGLAAVEVRHGSGTVKI